jgi:hypothetical protein
MIRAVTSSYDYRLAEVADAWHYQSVGGITMGTIILHIKPVPKYVLIPVDEE